MSLATFKQGTHTLTQIGQQNPDAEHLATLHDGYLTDLVQAIVEGSAPPRDDFRKFLGLTPVELRILVGYDLTLPKMIAAGHYDWVNSDITSERFPLSGKGKRNLVAEVIHLNRFISSEGAMAELDKMGLRPGKIEELLAFGATFPELQRKFSIVALGSSWTVGGRRSVAYLYGHFSRRRLDLGWWGDGWRGFYRFLAFRK